MIRYSGLLFGPPCTVSNMLAFTDIHRRSANYSDEELQKFVYSESTLCKCILLFDNRKIICTNATNLRITNNGNSANKLRHTRSVAYSVGLVLLNKHQISGGGAYLHSYPNNYIGN